MTDTRDPGFCDDCGTPMHGGECPQCASDSDLPPLTPGTYRRVCDAHATGDSDCAVCDRLTTLERENAALEADVARLREALEIISGDGVIDSAKDHARVFGSMGVGMVIRQIQQMAKRVLEGGRAK